MIAMKYTDKIKRTNRYDTIKYPYIMQYAYKIPFKPTAKWL